MLNILKSFTRPPAMAYEFPDVDELVIQPDTPQPPPTIDPTDPPDKAPLKTSPPPPNTPIDYATLQAEEILKDARQQAADLLEQARKEAALEAEETRRIAQDEGYRIGYVDGMAAATAQARQELEAEATRLEATVQNFLERAGQAQEEFMKQNADDLRDLAIAIAEKVVRVSLKSSSEVIGRMISAATEKRKRREWVHIYIAGCDARTMAQVPPALTAALSSLSDRVRIIPMADDESGTCVIEMPDEIIDASVSTQFSNIREILSDASHHEAEGELIFRPSV